MPELHYYIETFGCQMNVYDSELVAGLLQNCGYFETSNMDLADIIFLNTCAIREKAEETVHHRLESIHHLKKRKPHLIFGVLGCMAQHLKDDLLENVNIFHELYPKKTDSMEKIEENSENDIIVSSLF